MKGVGSGCERAVDGDLAFVHGFEQRRLRLGSGAIDLVGQQEIGEDRSGLELELLRVRVVDGDAEHVARQHVAGELQAVKAAVYGARQRLREGGLAHAGHVFDEKMTAGQQADEGQPHHFGLAPNRRAKRRLERCQFRKCDGRVECYRRGFHDFPLGH